MSLNWKEIDLVLSELELPGAHVQRILQPDYVTLLLELYRPDSGRFLLLVSLEPGRTRLHRTRTNYPKPKTSQRFSQFLTSRIRGGRIEEARQIGQERIVLLRISRGGEETRLWIRLWSGAANVIASDAQNRILDAFFRRPKRGEVTGGEFDPEAAIRPRGDGPAQVKEFTVRDLPGEGSFDELIDRFYGETGREDEIEKLRRQALQLLDRREAGLQASLDTLQRRHADYGQSEQYRHCGDMILANLHRIRKGEHWLTVTDHDADGQEVEIELDPRKSPRENAESYFQRYKKAKSGLGLLEDEIENRERALAQIGQERESIGDEEDPSVLSEIIAREQDQRQQEKQEKEGPPGLSFSSGGFTILVGRTARENDELLRRYVRGNDTWLHARDYPGGYVFIRTKPGKSVPLETLLDAGNLALFYSKGRNSGQGELYYTQVKYLRRAKDGKQGTVLPTQEKNLSVRLDQSRLTRLQKRETEG